MEKCADLPNRRGNVEALFAGEFQKQIEKSEFGGQRPQPMRYELWVVIAHPLGPSTITVMKIVIWRTKAFPFGEGGSPKARRMRAVQCSMSTSISAKWEILIRPRLRSATFPKGEGFGAANSNLTAPTALR